MQQDEFFPLDAIPPRVRRAILQEFQGRRPTVQEVAQISDRHWLATPDIGPYTLEKIHKVLRPQLQQGDGASPKMTDAELLDRLEFVQEELRRIRRILAHGSARPRESSSGTKGVCVPPQMKKLVSGQFERPPSRGDIRSRTPSSHGPDLLRTEHLEREKLSRSRPSAWRGQSPSRNR